MQPDINWHKIAENIAGLQFQNNNLLVLNVAGKKITLALHKNEIYALAYKCPHASGIMADGFIDAMDNIVCPLHRYKFNILNGRNTSGEGYRLMTYPVIKNEEGIFVGFEEKKLFGWL
jgi:3-phenylpropionate/trans-cinnamate dioxygenase ferredoxin subunit